MIVLVLTVATLLAAFLFHLGLWRLRVPVHQLKALLMIFMVFFAGATVAVAMHSSWIGFGDEGTAPWLAWLYFALFYWVAAFCYVITYSAMEGDSPTLSLTRHLHRRGSEGISHDEIEEFFRQRPFVGARVKALVTDNVFIEEQSGYRLSAGRYLFFRVILGYRRIVFGPIKSGG
jgi:hypothetical protein